MSRITAAWIVIALAGAGTYLIRASMLLAARRVATLPAPVREALRMIPPAALAAIAAPALFRPEGPIDLANPRLAAGVVAGIVAWSTKSLLATIAVGVGVVVVLETVLGLG